jgi:peptidoglycan/xylan/chitin deacetylase (PgdA/CDA1 family)
MYHSVSSNKAFFTVRVEDFENQMRYIKDVGYKVVSLINLIDMLNSNQSVGRCVAITFDDGYKDNFTTALPVLNKYGFCASVFVTLANIGSSMINSEGLSLAMMSKDEIVTMSKSGIDIMPHSRTHTDFSLLDMDAMEYEISGSRKDIEAITGIPANIFAYPKGKYSPAIVEFLRAKGYKGAVTVKPGMVHSSDPLFELKRNAVDSSTSFAEFKAKLNGAIEKYLSLKNRG